MTAGSSVAAGIPWGTGWPAAGPPAAEPPLVVYAAALRRAAAGERSDLTAVGTGEQVRGYLAATWCGDLRDGDEGLLHRCAGPTLDVGCGPGRLAGTLVARGQAALGIDVSAEALRLARHRGVRALRRDVFSRLPDEGRWQRVLLVDGNIGINGDPARLLRRCRGLAAPDGRILVEVDPPGARTWAGLIRIGVAGGTLSTPFPWAYLSVDDLTLFAAVAGLRVRERWTEAGRWFASLARG
jgi:SAM-dependent methyltransferase